MTGKILAWVGLGHGVGYEIGKNGRAVSARGHAEDAIANRIGRGIVESTVAQQPARLGAHLVIIERQFGIALAVLARHLELRTRGRHHRYFGTPGAGVSGGVWRGRGNHRFTPQCGAALSRLGAKRIQLDRAVEQRDCRGVVKRKAYKENKRGIPAVQAENQ